MSRGWIAAARFLLGLGLAGPALAGDGVLEINSACATGTGCFAGDTAGFPVTITGAAGRSYRLTSDLANGGLLDGISITADGISLDLGGFRILGTNTCSGVPTVCTGSASSTADGVVSNSNHGVEVRNGSVVGQGQHGIALFGNRNIVRNVRVAHSRLDGIALGDASVATGVTSELNGRIGIWAGEGSSLSSASAHQNGATGITALLGSTFANCASRGNGGFGITAGFNASVTNSIASQNTSHGISVGAGSAVTGSSAYGNGGSGIVASSGGALSASSAYNNGVDGFVVGSGSSVTLSHAAQNGDDGIDASHGVTISGCAAYSNGGVGTTGDGIEAGEGSLIIASAIRGNSGAGLRLLSDSGYRESVITDNTTAAVAGSGYQDLGSNHCEHGGATIACP